MWPAGALTGYPRFGDLNFKGTISADGIAWAVVCLALHLYALCQLVRDERVIRFRSDDEEQLWRFFYRRSGMGRLEFKQVGVHSLYDRTVRAAVWIKQPSLASLEPRYLHCVILTASHQLWQNMPVPRGDSHKN